MFAGIAPNAKYKSPKATNSLTEAQFDKESVCIFYCILKEAPFIFLYKQCKMFQLFNFTPMSRDCKRK